MKIVNLPELFFRALVCLFPPRSMAMVSIVRIGKDGQQFILIMTAIKSETKDKPYKIKKFCSFYSILFL